MKVIHIGFLDTREAAAYLGCSVATLKYHLYSSRQLVADGKIGPALAFTRPTLDRFAARRRRPGRPRKSV